MQRILIINGHPDKESLCNQLALSYKQGVETTTAECMLVNLSDLQFNPILTNGYRKRTELEPDLLMMQREILKATHIVLVYPNWWGTYPALLKGFFDRTFLPGYAFSYNENSVMVNKLLKGKTARLIVTMDSPKWYYSLFMGSPGHKSMKKGILEFSGIKPVAVTSFGPVRNSAEAVRKSWIARANQLGRELK